MYRDEPPLVTEEERKLAFIERTIEEIFQGITLFVDIRAGEDNRSEGIKIHLRSRGINITNNISEATHIIFKDGLKLTFEKAKQLNLPLVAVCWIQACERHKTLVDYKGYLAVNTQKYEDPILSKFIKNRKSIQPDPYFKPNEPKRRRKKIKRTDIEVDVETPETNKTIRTPKTIEVTVLARTKSTVSSKVTKNNETIHYECDVMEVSEKRHFYRDYNDSGSSKDATKIHEHQSLEPSQTALRNRTIPLSSTHLSESLQPRPNFDGTHMSPVLLSPLNKEASKLSLEQHQPIIETRILKKSSRKRKLFNPLMTPEEINHDERETICTPKDVPLPLEFDSSGDIQKEAERQPLILMQTQQAFQDSSPDAIDQVLTFIPHPSKDTNKQRFFVYSGLDANSKSLCKACVKELSGKNGKASIENHISKHTTHLMLQKPYAKTQKVLLAILRGVWVLDINYMTACKTAGFWVQEELYEVNGFLPGIAMARAERETFGNEYRLKLFSGKKFFVDPNILAGVNDIKNFIKLGGGKIMENGVEATYLIQDEPREDSPNDFQISSTWITDSIAAGVLQPIKNYLLRRLTQTQSQFYRCM